MLIRQPCWCWGGLFGRAESFPRRSCYNVSLTSVGEKGNGVAVNSNVRCKHNIAARVQESQWCPFWLSPGLGEAWLPPGMFFYTMWKWFTTTGHTFTRYFYPLNEQEDSCSVHLNGMTDMGHGLLLPRRSLMNTELISGTLVASDCWQKLCWWQSGWQREAGNMLPSMHQRELAIGWLPYKFII